MHLKLASSGGMVVMKDLMGQQQETGCPYKQPLTVKGQLKGSSRLYNIPCNTDCPLLEVNVSEDKTTADIKWHCGAGSRTEKNVAIRKPLNVK